MKHVLVPTEFSIASLHPVHGARQQFPEEIRITLLPLRHLTESMAADAIALDPEYRLILPSSKRVNDVTKPATIGPAISPAFRLPFYLPG